MPCVHPLDPDLNKVLGGGAESSDKKTFVNSHYLIVTRNRLQPPAAESLCEPEKSKDANVTEKKSEHGAGTRLHNTDQFAPTAGSLL